MIEPRAPEHGQRSKDQRSLTLDKGFYNSMSCSRDMAMAGTGSSSDTDIVALLNFGKLDLPVPRFSVAATNETILEFSNHLSGMGSLSLFHADEEMARSLCFTLKHLQNTIGTVLKTMGVSQKNFKRECSYVCPKCNETLTGNSIINIWENHSHFDELLSSALSNTAKSGNSSETEDENEEMEEQIEHTNDQGFSDGINDFRFNFVIKYDSLIERAIYPALLIKTMRKCEDLDCYTLQKRSDSYFICLLCRCELDIPENDMEQLEEILENHLLNVEHLHFISKSSQLFALREYHASFLTLEVPYQAHQIYFQPRSRKRVKCTLCNRTVPMKLVTYHINSVLHEENFKKLKTGKKTTSVYLREYQAMVYPGNHRIPHVKFQKLQKPSVKNAVQSKFTTEPKKEGMLLHDIRLAIENPESFSFLEQIPRRYEDHIKFLSEEGQNLFCELCRVFIDKSVTKLSQHLRLQLHQTLSNISFKKLNYYCYICKLKMYSELQWELHLLEYSEQHVSRNPNLVFAEYECLVCDLIFFGVTDYHLKHNIKQRLAVSLPPAVYNLLQSKALIQAECDRLTMEAEAVIKDELTLKCCEQLENVLKSKFPECKVYPFGSRVSGLGNRDSDLDMFLDSGGMYSGEKRINSHQKQVSLVKKVYSILMKLKEEFSCVIEISTARTPIVKFKHIATNVYCDLSFKHGLSVENTKFLKFCLALQPIAQPFILILKSWSSLNKMHAKISTYALAILAIFYLQVNSYLLSIKEIRQLDQGCTEVIGGWETINYTKSIEEIRGNVGLYPHSICKLLHDFFSYYHSFQFDQDVICPLLGTTIQKELFTKDNKNGRSLPPEMKRYVDQLGSRDAEVFKTAAFCIQDPFDLSHNLTKACDKGIVSKFQHLCWLSLYHLNNLE